MRRKRQCGHLGGNVIGGDANTYYPELWRHLVSTFAAKSVLDVGCGEGNALEFFVSLGLRSVGMDGLADNVR